MLCVRERERVGGATSCGHCRYCLVWSPVWPYCSWCPSAPRSWVGAKWAPGSGCPTPVDCRWSARPWSSSGSQTPGSLRGAPRKRPVNSGFRWRNWSCGVSFWHKTCASLVCRTCGNSRTRPASQSASLSTATQPVSTRAQTSPRNGRCSEQKSREHHGANWSNRCRSNWRPSKKFRARRHANLANQSWVAPRDVPDRQQWPETKRFASGPHRRCYM